MSGHGFVRLLAIFVDGSASVRALPLRGMKFWYDCSTGKKEPRGSFVCVKYGKEERMAAPATVSTVASLVNACL